MAGAWIVGCAAAAVMALTASTPCRADNQNLFVGDTLACDSPQEIQVFMKGSRDETIGAALTRVNRKFGRDACNLGTILFTPEGKVTEMLGPEGLIEIEQVEVVGEVTSQAMLRFADPMTQYVAILEKGLDV